MGVVAVKFMGGWGNQLFQYAFGRGYAEATGSRLETEPWVGQQVFEINDPQISGSYKRLEEHEVDSGETNVEFRTYAQNQKCADFYSVAKVRKWFKFRPDVQLKLQSCRARVACHYRCGDYPGAGYPVVSKAAFKSAVTGLGYLWDYCQVVSQDQPQRVDGVPDFLQDFYTLMTATTLFRSNSTFSWWAATLGQNEVYSPVIEGKVGGVEHDDIRFVKGNHPRTAELAFVTNIHLQP